MLFERKYGISCRVRIFNKERCKVETCFYVGPQVSFKTRSFASGYNLTLRFVQPQIPIAMGEPYLLSGQAVSITKWHILAMIIPYLSTWWYPTDLYTKNIIKTQQDFIIPYLSHDDIIFELEIVQKISIWAS